MKLIGCQSEMDIIPCGNCNLNGYPHRCNVFRDEHGMDKIFSWEWIETPESSNIEMFAYEEGLLRVQFKNGTMYDYFEVPRNIYEEMSVAESKGKYLNANLKGKFKTVTVE